MEYNLGSRIGRLTLIGKTGRKWLCRCDCGRVEARRVLSAAEPDVASTQACGVCSAPSCLECGHPVLRKRARYCSVECLKTVTGRRQADYYRRRATDPAFMKQRQERRSERRARMGPDQIEARRAQNRAYLSNRSEESRIASAANQRRWYLRNAERIRIERNAARAALTDEHRAARKAYMNLWYERRLEYFKQNPRAEKEWRVRKAVALRLWAMRRDQEEMISDMKRLMEVDFG